MNELIKVAENEQKEKIVSAREVYGFLEISERFSGWFTRVLQFGFEEGEDFTSVKSFTVVNNGAKKEIQDYHIKLDMAKEVSMLARSEKGKQARKYFIECEKKLKEVALHSYQIEDPIERAKSWIIEQEEKKLLEQKIEKDKPLNDFANKILKSRDNMKIGVFAKLMFDDGMDIGERRLFAYLRENKVLALDNTPYQQYLTRGYFALKEGAYDTPMGSKLYTTTLITPKGQVWLYGKLKKREQ